MDQRRVAQRIPPHVARASAKDNVGVRRVRWPFQLAEITDYQIIGVAVTLKRPRGDHLPARLRRRSKFEKVSLCSKPRLLLEFTSGGIQRVLTFHIFSFRDRPGSEILLRPKWTS